MGKGNKGRDGGGKGGDNRARAKVNHRDGRGGRGEDREDDVPQELIDRAAVLGCEVW